MREGGYFTDTWHIIKVVIPILFILLSGCSTTRYIEEGRYIFDDVEIDVENSEQIDDEEIRDYLTLERNTRFLWVPRYHYYLRQQEKDSSAYRDFIMRWMAEEPVYADSGKVISIKEKIETYLWHRGFFDAEVVYDIAYNDKKRKASVDYTVEPGKPFIIDSFFIVAADESISGLIDSFKPQLKLHEGSILSSENFFQDKEYITRVLRDRGYATFVPNYIRAVDVDTLTEKNEVTLRILNPPEEGGHQVYKIGEVILQFNNAVEKKIFLDSTVVVYYSGTRPPLKLNAIRENLFIQPGKLYKETALDNTLIQLGNLEILSYPSYTINFDTAGRDNPVINLKISLNTNKRYAFDQSFDLFISNISNTQLLGLGGSFGLSHRNIFGGGEVGVFGVEGSVELGFRSSRFNTYNFGLNTGITFPEYKPLVNSLSWWKCLPFISSTYLGEWRKFSRTRMGGFYNYTSFQNYYHFHSLQFTYEYFLSSPEKNMLYRPLGMNLWSPTLEPEFIEIVGENQFYLNSFQKRLMTGFVFRNYEQTHKYITDNEGSFWQTFIGFELSGFEVHLLNLSANVISGSDDVWKIGIEEINFSKFIRLDGEVSRTKQFNLRNSMAFRGVAGIALPYGPDQNVPYIKQYFSGGPYSIRAWQIRELGPGEFLDSLSRAQNRPFYSTGDLRLEANAEYRFDIIWYLEGAVFIDAGNVWALEEIDQDPEVKTRFDWDFYEHIAIGTGFGIRFDYEYFILRLDLGMKVRSPYIRGNDRWYISSLNEFLDQPVNFNFAINYPF